MIIMFGKYMCGKVDHVPGVCYVGTMFAHLNCLPLFPIGSYIVVEGSEEGGDFRGKQVGMCLRSVLAGYLRAWCGVVVVVSGIFAWASTYNNAGFMPLGAVALGAMLVMAACGLAGLFVNGRGAVVAQAAAHFASAVLLYATTDAVAQNALPAEKVSAATSLLVTANIALLVYGLTRFFDRAGPARTRELLEQLGVELPPEDGDESEEKPEKKWEDWDENEDRRRRGG